MKKINTLLLIGLMLFFTFFAQAQTYSRTVTVVFNGDPGPVTVKPANFRYDKDFAYSLTLDDVNSDVWAIAYPLLHGGNVLSEYGTGTNYGTGIGDYDSDGYFLNDGCGTDVPFTIGLAVPSNSVQGEGDAGIPFLKWSQLQLMYDAGWDILNHSSSHPYNPNISVGNDEIDDASKKIEDNIGFYPRHFVIPSNYGAFVTEFGQNDHGMIAI